MQLGPETCEEGDLLVLLCCCVISTDVGLQPTVCTKKKKALKECGHVYKWLQIKLTGWKLRDTFRKMTGY